MVAIALVAGAATLVPNLAAGQVAGLGGSVTPAFTNPVTVGAQNQPAIVQLVNGAFGPQAATETLTISNIELNPSCQDSTNQPQGTGPSPCLAGTTEPRPNPALPVLALNPPTTVATTPPGGPLLTPGPPAAAHHPPPPPPRPAPRPGR